VILGSPQQVLVDPDDVATSRPGEALLKIKDVEFLDDRTDLERERT